MVSKYIVECRDRGSDHDGSPSVYYEKSDTERDVDYRHPPKQEIERYTDGSWIDMVIEPTEIDDDSLGDERDECTTAKEGTHCVQWPGCQGMRECDKTESNCACGEGSFSHHT